MGWSDQWAFWKHGWLAMTVTDTALYGDPHYHTLHDTPDKLDYDGLARVVKGRAWCGSWLRHRSSTVALISGPDDGVRREESECRNV